MNLPARSDMFNSSGKRNLIPPLDGNALPIIMSSSKRIALDRSHTAALLNNNSSLNISNSASAKGNDSKPISLLEPDQLGSFSNTKQFYNSLRTTPVKTPIKSPKKSSGYLTPGRKTPRTPGGPDRFIPSRRGADIEKGQFLLLHNDLSGGNNSAKESPSQRNYRIKMSERLHGCDIEQLDKCKVMTYKTLTPGSVDKIHGPYEFEKLGNSINSPSKKVIRQIPQVPERILDAPDIINDYYLSPLDWSSNNQLAVALSNHVYIWDPSSGGIEQLLELDIDDYVCSVSWIKEGNILAVGDNRGNIQIWDASRMKKVRVMTGHSDRVTCLSWNEYILTSGSRSGEIHHSDVRIASHLAGVLRGHTQEVCGLSYSPDRRMLASGGNDNVLNIWQVIPGQCVTEATPKFTFNEHQAAVKGLAWCPWQPSILASGGGTADRTIKLWNCNNGSLIKTVDTKSQVCSLLWSNEYRELVSAHGFANNEIIIWRYPSMVKVAELTGHTERVLHLALSSDETTVVSAGADETLRLWKCFPIDPNKNKNTPKSKNSSLSQYRSGIR